MENKIDIERLDHEWIELIQIAKTLGLSSEEVHLFFMKNRKAD